MSSPTKRTGSCLCGSIKLEITGDPLWVNLCHCESCQKSSGVVFASMSFWKLDQVTFSIVSGGGDDTIKTYRDGSPDSGNTLLRSFCANCGSRVKAGREQNAMGVVGLPTGIIDGEKKDLAPSREFFCYERAAWLGELVDAGVKAERFERMPPA